MLSVLNNNNNLCALLSEDGKNSALNMLFELKYNNIFN